jgi:hypothetical protein
MLSASLLAACEAPVTIGVEHRITVAALAADPATGELLQAGFRNAGTATAPESDLWYGRVRPDGRFVRPAVSLDVAGGADAIQAAARLSTGWVVAGHSTSAGGARTAFVRVLDDQENEVWTTELGGRAGTQTSAHAVAVAFDESIVVGGVEAQPDGGDDGWLARVAADGGTLWRHSFAVDYQQQASASTVLGIGLIPPSVAQIYTVGRRVRDGGVGGVGLQFSLDGDLFDSHWTDQGGTGVGVFIDDLRQLTTCAAGDDGVVYARVVDRDFAPSRELPFQLAGAKLELAGCAQTTQTLWVAATAVHAAGGRKPWFARIDKASFSVSDSRELELEERSTTVFAVQVDGAGKAWLAGRGDALLRRWMGALP